MSCKVLRSITFLTHSVQSRGPAKTSSHIVSQARARPSAALCSDFISARLASFPLAHRFLTSVPGSGGSVLPVIFGDPEIGLEERHYRNLASRNPMNGPVPPA